MRLSNTKQVLLDMLSDVDYILERGYRSPGIGISINDLRKIDENKKRQEQYQVMRRLKKRKLIEEVKKGEEIIHQLTDNGTIEALKLKILTCEQELPSFEACLVVFDVPESMKKVRDQIRLLLKRSGFNMIQRSVWETTFDVVNDLDELVDRLGMQENILVYRVLRKLHNFKK